MKKIFYSIACLLLTGLVCFPSDLRAGSYAVDFNNKFDTDAIYLFLFNEDDNKKDVIFQEINFSTPSNWSVADFSPDYLHLTSTAAAIAGDFDYSITFSDGEKGNGANTFRIEWAEYLNGLPSGDTAQGSLTFSGSMNSAPTPVSNDVFTSTVPGTVPTPIPASTWLLLSGIFFLVGVRRHARR